LAAAALAALLVAGCSTQPGLTPAAGTQAAQVPHGAVASQDGVQVVAATPDWPGRFDITKNVTPMQVSIENGSSKPISVHYADLGLVTPDGTVYNALPLDEITGDITRPAAPSGYPGIEHPGFYGDGFSAAPYDGMYPGEPAYDGAFGYGTGFDDRYDNTYVQASLPTPDMRQMALPEGVLQPGQRAQGWVYFPKLPPQLSQVTMRTDAVDAASGQTFASVAIPFSVE
jgi:hypothetical protein